MTPDAKAHRCPEVTEKARHHFFELHERIRALEAELARVQDEAAVEMRVEEERRADLEARAEKAENDKNVFRGWWMKAEARLKEMSARSDAHLARVKELEAPR